MTQNRNEIQRGLMMRLDAIGITKFRDTCLEAVRYLAQEGRNDKKALVIISDGLDNKSKVKLDSLNTALLESDILVYALAPMGNVNVSEVGTSRKVLKNITEETGGFAHHATDFAELRQHAERIARELQSQYVLTYLPVNQSLDQKFRSIKLTVQGSKKDVQVRTKSGYYATPVGFR